MVSISCGKTEKDDAGKPLIIFHACIPGYRRSTHHESSRQPSSQSQREPRLELEFNRDHTEGERTKAMIICWRKKSVSHVSFGFLIFIPDYI